jgi:hypothetical protein
MKSFLFIYLLFSLNADNQNTGFIKNYKEDIKISNNNLILIIKTEPHSNLRNTVLHIMDRIDLKDNLTRIYIDNNKTTFLKNYFKNTIIVFDKSKKVFINAIFSNFGYNNINDMIKYELKLQEF